MRHHPAVLTLPMSPGAQWCPSLLLTHCGQELPEDEKPSENVIALCIVFPAEPYILNLLLGTSFTHKESSLFLLSEKSPVLLPLDYKLPISFPGTWNSLLLWKLKAIITKQNRIVF